MPTVSSHDVLGPLSCWGAGANARHLVRDSFAPIAHRSGINAFFGEGEGVPNGGVFCQARHPAAAVSLQEEEHAYSAAAAPDVVPRSCFVSQSGYYGFQQRPASVEGDAAEDCAMDVSENNPPALGFGDDPSRGGALGRTPQDPWHASRDPTPMPTTRKRSLEALGGAEAAEAGHASHDGPTYMPVKRTRHSPAAEDPGASTQTVVQGFGVLSSTPSIAEQTLTPAAAYDLPTQLLPRTTYPIADAMTPRPRCLMGHFI